MPIGLKMPTDVLKDVTARLSREEAKEEPEIKSILYALSSITFAALGIVASTRNVYERLLSIEKDHNSRLLVLSKKVIYLSAAISIGGTSIILIAKLIIGFM